MKAVVCPKLVIAILLSTALAGQAMEIRLLDEEPNNPLFHKNQKAGTDKPLNAGLFKEKDLGQKDPLFSLKSMVEKTEDTPPYEPGNGGVIINLFEDELSNHKAEEWQVFPEMDDIDHLFKHKKPSINIMEDDEEKPDEVKEKLEISVPVGKEEDVDENQPHLASVFDEKIPLEIKIGTIGYLTSSDYYSLSRVSKGCARDVDVALRFYIASDGRAFRFFQDENLSMWQLKRLFDLDNTNMTKRAFSYVKTLPQNPAFMGKILDIERRIKEENNRQNQRFVNSQCHKRLENLFKQKNILIDDILKIVKFLPPAYLLELQAKKETSTFIQKLTNTIIKFQNKSYTFEKAQTAFKYIDCLLLLSCEEPFTMLRNIPVAIAYGEMVIKNEQNYALKDPAYQRVLSYFDQLVEWTRLDLEYEENFSKARDFYESTYAYYDLYKEDMDSRLYDERIHHLSSLIHKATH